MSIVQVVAAVNNEERAVGWVSFQPDGSVSVGLSDKTFVTPQFSKQNFVWNANNQQTLEFLVPNNSDSLQLVRNPHLTSHPPNYFHLRENGKDELWAGIADIAIMLEQDRRIPWVRFVSKQFSELKLASTPRGLAKTTIRKVELENPDASVCLAVDFLHQKGDEPPEWVSKNLQGATGGVKVDINAFATKPQISTLAWLHHC
jgi:hypothetical protein